MRADGDGEVRSQVLSGDAAFPLKLAPPRPSRRARKGVRIPRELRGIAPLLRLILLHSEVPQVFVKGGRLRGRGRGHPPICLEGGKTEGFSKFLELHLYGLYLCSGPLGPALGWESGAGVGWGSLLASLRGGLRRLGAAVVCTAGGRGGRWSRMCELAGGSLRSGAGSPWHAGGGCVCVCGECTCPRLEGIPTPQPLKYAPSWSAHPGLCSPLSPWFPAGGPFIKASRL